MGKQKKKMDFTKRIKDLMECCKYTEIQEEILDPKNRELVENESLELISKICELGLITITTKDDGSVSACMELLVNIAQISPSKESIIAFLEQAEYAIVCNRLCHLLPPIQTTLLNSAVKLRTLHLSTFLELMERNLQIHCSFPNKIINNYKYFPESGGGEEAVTVGCQIKKKPSTNKKRELHPLEKVPTIQNILCTYQSYLYFIEPFVNEFVKLGCTPVPSLQSNGEIGIDSSLVLERERESKIYRRFLMMLLGKPLVHFDLSCNASEEELDKTVQSPSQVKSEGRLVGEKIIRLLSKLDNSLANYLHLIQLNLVEDDFRIGKKGKKKGGDEEQSHQLLSYVMDETEEEEDEEEYDDPGRINDKVSMMGLANFFYLVYPENINFFNLPCVYMPSYIFKSCLPVIAHLFNDSTNDHQIQLKGIRLASNLLDQISLQSPFHLQSKFMLEKYKFKEFITKIIDITIYTEPKQVRKAGIETIKTYLWSFSPCGRYDLLNNLFNTLNHAGMYGYMITQLKDFVSFGTREDETSPMRTHFSGNKLKSLLTTICKLKEGANTDLMHSYDRIVCALNFLRFLLISDGVYNRTGFLDCMLPIEETFLKPLRIGLDLSVVLYRGRLESLERETKGGPTSGEISKGKDKKKKSEEQFFSLTIGDKELNIGEDDFDIPIEEQLEAVQSTLSSFDLLYSLLSLVNQNLESSAQKRRILCTQNNGL